MQVVPVLDLLGGEVVRGAGGRRAEYRPIRSPLVDRSEPLFVARTFRATFGTTRLYVADLDAIVHRRPNAAVHAALLRDGFDLLLDAGLRDADDLRALPPHPSLSFVAGLETSSGPAALRRIRAALGGGRLIFGLDLKRGEPLGDPSAWGTSEPLDIAAQAVDCGADGVLVLDLADVGAHSGTATESICRTLRARFPRLGLIAGGGVRGPADLESLAAWGLDACLVASALHDGRIVRAALERVGRTDRGTDAARQE